jgi:hypothetical protein
MVSDIDVDALCISYACGDSLSIANPLCSICDRQQLIIFDVQLWIGLFEMALLFSNCKINPYPIKAPTKKAYHCDARTA